MLSLLQTVINKCSVMDETWCMVCLTATTNVWRRPAAITVGKWLSLRWLRTIISILFHNTAIRMKVCYGRGCRKSNRNGCLILFRFYKNTQQYVCIYLPSLMFTLRQNHISQFFANWKDITLTVTCTNCVRCTHYTLIFKLCFFTFCLNSPTN
jgi:hypothetical protein